MKVAISLTTIPNRERYLNQALESIVADAFGIADIFLYVKHGYTPSIRNSKAVNVVQVKDVGSFTKIRYSAEMDGYDYIITADDDVKYPKGWTEGLIGAMANDDSKSYGYRGRLLNSKSYVKSSLLTSKSIKKPTNVSILTGTWGCIYNRLHFDDSFLTPPPIFDGIDDIWISGYLASKGIERVCIPFNKDILPTQAYTISSLWSRNSKSQHNDVGIKYFNGKL